MLTEDPKVVRQVAEQLGNYVYVLVDPLESLPFYVGKGVGARMLQHGIDAAELSAADDEGSGETSRKIARIQSIRAAGAEPDIWVLRYGMSASEYTAVEAAAIDLLLSFPIRAAVRPDDLRLPLAEPHQLTNARREASRNFGIATLSQLVNDLAAPPLTTDTPLLLITLRQWVAADEPLPGGGTRTGFGFKRIWLDDKQRRQDIVLLSDATRCWWGISPQRVAAHGIEHAVAVHGSVTRALFRIIPNSWEQLKIRRRGFSVEPILHGNLFDDVVGPHGHRVPQKARGDQSQFNYWPRA
ncbi:MAG: GIY-YIG nuclease family protein [Pseudonocardia sp.]|nr:GIY-YIG nuclease family protein [Pseudonocardia sp.]